MPPKTGRRIAAAGCLLAVALAGVPAIADDPDPWWGTDKALHLGISTAIASAGYGIGAACFDARYKAMLLGGGVAIGVGAAKEAWDATGHGDPSWKDFTWDVIGAVLGVAIGWSIDLAVRGTGQQHPLLGPPTTMQPLGMPMRPSSLSWVF